jgi:hypothetical protein
MSEPIDETRNTLIAEEEWKHYRKEIFVNEEDTFQESVWWT